MNISSFYLCFFVKKMFSVHILRTLISKRSSKTKNKTPIPETKVETFLTIYLFQNLSNIKYFIKYKTTKLLFHFFYWITITNTRKKWYNEKYISQHYYSETYQLCLNTYCFLAAMISSKWAFVLLWLLSLMNFYFFFF